MSSDSAIPWSCASTRWVLTWAGTSGLWRIVEKSSPFAFHWAIAERVSSRSTRPTISSTVRKPSFAIRSRSSSARRKKKLTTCSGWPLNRARSSGSCVAMPTGQVLRWHFRIMMQPITTSAPVAMPNSSAPSIVAIATSLAVRIMPSVWTVIRPRRSFMTST